MPYRYSSKECLINFSKTEKKQPLPTNSPYVMHYINLSLLKSTEVKNNKVVKRKKPNQLMMLWKAQKQMNKM